MALTLSQTTNFRLFQTERVCRRQIFLFDENGGKCPRRVKNIVREGEIDRYDKFMFDGNGGKFSKRVENIV